MPYFIGGAVQLHRQLKGLLLPGLPRGQIPAREVEGEGCYLLFPFAPPSPSSLFAAAVNLDLIQLLKVLSSAVAALS